MLLHASLPTGLLPQSMLLYLSWEANKVRNFFFFFGGIGEEEKEQRIFSPSTMSCEFDLMHLEFIDLLAFHWWMMELS